MNLEMSTESLWVTLLLTFNQMVWSPGSNMLMRSLVIVMLSWGLQICQSSRMALMKIWISWISKTLMLEDLRHLAILMSIWTFRKMVLSQMEDFSVIVQTSITLSSLLVAITFLPTIYHLLEEGVFSLFIQYTSMAPWSLTLRYKITMMVRILCIQLLIVDSAISPGQKLVDWIQL